MQRAIVALILFLLVGCEESRVTTPSVSGTATSPSPSAATTPSPTHAGTLYESSGVVVETPKEGPKLCLGGAEDSAPPQCGGLPLKGWDWGQVEGEESLAGAKWGDFLVSGTFDGKAMTVKEAGPIPPFSGEDREIETPCEEPEDGWSSVDPNMTSDKDIGQTQLAAEREPDFSGLWPVRIDAPDEPFDDVSVVLNVAFSGDLERHEAQVRETWGGPLCMVEFEYSLEELSEIREEVQGEFGKGLGLETLESDTDVTRNVIHIGVIVAPAEAEAEIENRYGPDVVELRAQLHPVDS